MIEGVTNSDSLPVLERMVQFTGQRHRLLAHNIANLDTPGFRPADVSVEGFQARLGEAIDSRREAFGNAGGRLELDESEEVGYDGFGSLRLNPQPAGANILFHDRNDRDLERTMQALVENFMSFRFAAEMLRSRFDLINTAIRERV